MNQKIVLFLKSRALIRGLLFGCLIYVLLVGLMCILENQLVFRAESDGKFWKAPPSADIQEVTFSSSDGNQIHAWYLPKSNSTEVVLFCHGNSQNLSAFGGSIMQIREKLDCSVLIFDYPGYGKSTGTPSESGCYESAEAAWEWLCKSKGFSEQSIILYGESLGGGIASEMALRHPCRLLVLVKTFTSLPDVGMHRYPWIPVYLVMRTQFDTLKKIDRIHSPVFVTGATKDSTVPYVLSEELIAKANEPKAFFALIDHDHGDLLTDEYFEKLNAFIASTKKPKESR